MKKLITLFVLLWSIPGESQIINFPDANFKNFLVNYDDFFSGQVIDTNGDGEITVSEAYNFGFTSPALSIHQGAGPTAPADITGIEYFTTISELNITSVNITSADLSALNLTDLGIGFCPNLVNVTLSNPAYLLRLWITHCNLGSFDPGPAYVNLYSLDLGYNHLTTIDLANFPALEYFLIGFNELTTLTLDGLTHLSSVSCENNLLTNISSIGTAPDYQLNCQNNKFTVLDLSGTSVGTINCDHNLLLTTINLGNTNNHETLNASYCPQLYYINIKNGRDMYSPGPNVLFCPNLRYICCDASEVGLAQDFLTQYNLTNVYASSYCEMVPGGPGASFYTISGTVKFDSDNNGCSAADPQLPYLTMNISDLSGNTASTMVDPVTGNYLFFLSSGTWSLSPYFVGTSSLFNVVQSGGSPVINAGNPHSTIDFCISPTVLRADLEITITPLGSTNPGFPASYQMSYRNKGTQSISGTVQMNFDDAKMDFTSSSIAPSSQSTGILSWTYANLLPFESRSIIVEFAILPPPDNNAGDTLVFSSTVNPVAGDEVPADNSFSYSQVVSGPYDPNDKVCVQGKYIAVAELNKDIDYIIHFQNLGTANAVNVVIRDSIFNNLDEKTLQLVASSHTCTFTRTGKRVDFYFNNINLVPQSTNDEASKGYLIFKLRPSASAGFRDTIINRASIYFDFNAPIVTNDAITIIDSAGILVPVTLEYFKGSRQNNRHLLTWKANCTTGEAMFEIEKSTDGRKFIPIGSITSSDTRCMQPFNFTDNEPVTGINYYRIKIKDQNGKVIYSNTITLMGKNTGFEILSLAPNPVTGKNCILNIVADQTQQIKINIIDITGRSVHSHSQTLIAGSSQLEMNFTSLQKGNYMMEVSSNEGIRRTIRFVKQ